MSSRSAHAPGQHLAPNAQRWDLPKRAGLARDARFIVLGALLGAALQVAAQAPAQDAADAVQYEKRDWRQIPPLSAVPSTTRVVSWSGKQYDPKPDPDGAADRELHLPMPCGGVMVFRRIDVGGGAGLLGEHEIELGSPNAEDAPRDQPRRAFLSGAFGGAALRPGGRHFYLGKYEVTTLQYQVVQGPCPASLKGRRPAREISWYDAVDFTRHYTEWLHQNAADRLPRADGVRGHLRLPTEDEWEYAARGGIAVDANEFRQPLFPMAGESVESYAWIRESVMSNYAPRPVGSLRPNPLGLYDILGNAAELVLDPYRLSIQGHLHGQAGGFLAKGGHFRSWRKGLSTSWRREHPHFNPRTGAVNRLDSVGFRVAVSAPVLTSDARIDALRDEHERLPPVVAGAAARGRCDHLALEIRDSLSTLQSNLERCLVASGAMALAPFPEPLTAPPQRGAELPAWEQVRKALPSLAAEETRRYGTRYLQANEPDRALVLFKQAARKGDSWSALAIGALYDPALFEAPHFTPQHTPFSKPNPDMAACWYRVAQSLGEKRATLRLDVLEARRRASSPGRPGQVSAAAGCEQILLQYGAK